MGSNTYHCMLMYLDILDVFVCFIVLINILDFKPFLKDREKLCFP